MVTKTISNHCPFKARPILKYSRFKIAKMQHPEILQIPVLAVSLANLQQNIVFFLAMYNFVCFKFILFCLFIWLLTGRALQYGGRIQRKTWCMGPYAGGGYNLTLCPLQSRIQHIYHGQPYARVDPNPMLESTLALQSGTFDLASVHELLRILRKGTFPLFSSTKFTSDESAYRVPNRESNQELTKRQASI
jgi:hypothetical protein